MPPQPIQPAQRAGAVYRVDNRLEGNIRSSFQARQNLFTHNLNQEGVHLFQERTPGRVFNLGDGSYHYNTGTAPDGSYIPSFTHSRNGRITYGRLRDYDPNARPSNPQDHARRAIEQLDLADNGNGTYNRRGFVGSYTVRNDGGIEFSGGGHESSPNIRFDRQIYYNGHWYRMPRATGGIAPGRRRDTFSTTTQPSSVTQPAPLATSERSSLPRVTPRRTETTPLPTTITTPQPPPPSTSLPPTSGTTSPHPEELRPLIQSVRRYYQQSSDYAGGTRPGAVLPDRQGIPRGFHLMPGGNEFTHSTHPGHWFISSRDSEGRAGVYYRPLGSTPYWRSMATDDDKWFSLQGGRMGEVNREGSPVSGAGTTATQVPRGTGGVLSAPPAAQVSDIPARAGDAVGYAPRQGETPFRTEEFNTDLTTLGFQARRNARNINVNVGFKPQYATSRDWLDNRVSAHRDLAGARIRIVPIFARQTHRGARGTWQSETLTGYRVEFYQAGSYQATTRQNYATWYSLDGTARAANSSSYPVEDIPITVEEPRR